MAKKINDLFFMRPWAIKEDVFQKMLEIVERHLRGEKLTPEEINAQIGADKKGKPDYEVINGTAIIPIYGIIAKRVSQVRGISQPQGTTIEEIKRDLMAAIEDPAVERIILDIDSPGGSVDGIDEFSDFIYNLRSKKQIIAYANGQMASAAYYIGSAAEKVYASKSSEVGSIGVYAVVTDWTVANHQAGLKTEIIKAGKYKAAGHPDKPLTEEDRKVIQEEINTYYELFVEAVMRNRGMSEAEMEEAATGRTWIGKKALAMGLIDDVLSFEEIMKMTGGVPEKSSARAAAPGSHNNIIKNNLKKEEENMDITVEKLKAEHKDIAEALIAEGKDLGLKEGKESGVKEGKEIGLTEGKKLGVEETNKTEKARVDSICAAMPKGMEAVALQCIHEGKTIEESKDMFLKTFKDAAAKNPGADEDPNLKNQGTEVSIEEKCKKEWEGNPKLQQEFASLETYTGYKRAEAKGRIRLNPIKK